MEPGTAAALRRINRDFYRRRAAEFSVTREQAWPAWTRVAELVGERAPAGLSVLDLGCGNGRLGRFLEGRWGGRLEYLGIDGSEQMLAIARAKATPGQLLCRDLVRAGLPAGLPGEPFGLVAAFGLLHHLPGLDARAALLGEAARRLAPGGLLAVSFWQFGAHPRFRRRIVPWEVYNATAAEAIDPEALEQGDALLAWGETAGAGERAAVRYCHWATPEEADRLLAALGLETVASFRSDGRGGDLNLYRVLAAPG